MIMLLIFNDYPLSQLHPDRLTRLPTLQIRIPRLREINLLKFTQVVIGRSRILV